MVSIYRRKRFADMKILCLLRDVGQDDKTLNGYSQKVFLMRSAFIYGSSQGKLTAFKSWPGLAKLLLIIP